MCGCQAHYNKTVITCYCHCASHTRIRQETADAVQRSFDRTRQRAVTALMSGLTDQANRAPLVYLTTRNGVVLGWSVYRQQMRFKIHANGTGEQVRSRDGLILHEFTSIHVADGDTADITVFAAS